MLLAAEYKGLAACPLGMAKAFVGQEIQEFLKFDPAQEELVLSVAIGWPASKEHIPEKTVSSIGKIYWL